MPTEITSTLLSMVRNEANHRDHQAREALFLTFNCDLGFFESQVLGTVRGTGAAVTVIADPKVYEPDPRAVRSAGIHYCIGLASMPAVFHPKLSIIAGPKRAALAIGSGNLSVGGWHLNDEVLTVVTGDAETGCPLILREVADWLQLLAVSQTIVLGPSARAGVERTAEQLTSLCDRSQVLEQGPSLISNFGGAILEQLPTEHVDELRLFAPFHDLQGHALDKLLVTLRPERVRIAIQNRFTVIDPLALLELAQRHEVDLRFEQAEGTNYRHGKIIEAHHRGNLIWSLSGSPNLSRQALIRSVDHGGNCELAVLDIFGKNLYPPTSGTIATGNLASVPSGPPSAEEEPLRRLARDGLLEASLDGETIRLYFAKTLTNTSAIEISSYRTDPDHFTTVATLDPGHAHYEFISNPDWEYPLRLRVRVNDTAGPIHFVTRPDQTALRVSGRGGVRTPDLDPDQIFTDDLQARQWLSAVTQLALSAQPMKASPSPRLGNTTAPTKESSPAGMSWDDPAAWHVYVDDAAQRLGESMLSFALGGLPRIAFTSGGGRAAWEDDFLKNEDAVAEDVAGDDQEDGLWKESEDESANGQPQRDLSSAERERFRRWLAVLVEPPLGIPAIDRVARARIMLLATRMKLWETGSEAPWFELLVTAAKSLRGEDIPPQYQDRISALTQVIVYELAVAARQIGTSRFVGGRLAMNICIETEKSLADLLQPVDLSLLESYADTLSVKGAAPPDADLIALHAASTLAEDPTEQALGRLAFDYPDLDVATQGEGVLIVRTPERNPLPAAGRCLDAVVGDWAVYATSDGGRRAFAARVGNRMFITQRVAGNTKVRYRPYTLTDWVTPTRITEPSADQNDIVGADEKPPVNSVGKIGAQVLAKLGVDPLHLTDFLQDGTS